MNEICVLILDKMQMKNAYKVIYMSNLNKISFNVMNVNWI